MEKQKTTQGEILMILVHRSGITGKEAAEKLKIHPSHLSKMFRSEFLTEKMRRKVCEVFGEPPDIWTDPDKIRSDMVAEPSVEYRRAEKWDDSVLEKLERIESVLEAMQADQRTERGRLLAIVEKLTGTRQ